MINKKKIIIGKYWGLLFTLIIIFLYSNQVNAGKLIDYWTFETKYSVNKSYEFEQASTYQNNNLPVTGASYYMSTYDSANGNGIPTSVQINEVASGGFSVSFWRYSSINNLYGNYSHYSCDSVNYDRNYPNIDLNRGDFVGVTGMTCYQQFAQNLDNNAWHAWFYTVTPTTADYYIDGQLWQHCAGSSKDLSDNWGLITLNDQISTAGIADFAIYSGNFSTSTIADFYDSRQTASKYFDDKVTITSASLNSSTKIISLAGTCKRNGSGVYQMKLAGSRAVQELNSDYISIDRTKDSLVDCLEGGTWSGTYDANGLTGELTMIIDDTFYGTTLASSDIYINFDDQSNIYSNIITPTSNIYYGSLEANTYQVLSYDYNTNAISNGIFGGMAYIEAGTCIDIGCSTSNPIIFDNGTDATSTKSFILSGSTVIATSTSTYGKSNFIIGSAGERLGTSTEVQERIKVTPYYFNVKTLKMIKANPVVFVINWLTKDQISNGVPDNNTNPPCVEQIYDLSKEAICYDEELATSTDPMALSCVIKWSLVNTTHRVFYPSCEALNSISDNYYSFKRSFPFNTFYDLTDSITKAINSAENATSSNSFSIPFIKQTATSSEYYMLPVMSSTTISNTIGKTNYGTFRTTIGYIWWLIIAVIVYFTVRRI